MDRDLQQLSGETFDVLVIGAGINGACVARDAAMRGLRTAVIDAGDFGSGTSANSLRIVHGGLRYLQHLDFRRMRESIRERSMWLRTAPHLVHLLPCLSATTKRLTRTRSAFRAAFCVNDLVGWDRNRGAAVRRRIPGGKILSRDEALTFYPGNDADAVTGGAVWHDGQMYHSERLVWAVLADAARYGAVLGNHVCVEGLEIGGGRLEGIQARDVIGDVDLRIRAKLTINASGPFVDQLVSRSLERETPSDRVVLSKAMNLLTRRIAGDVAVGVPSRYRNPNAVMDGGTRLLFVTPWRDLTMVGTTHFAYEGDPADFRITEEDVGYFLEDVNSACPEAHLTLDDVHGVCAGLLPAADRRNAREDVRTLQRHRILDHESMDGVAGLLSLVGVKYTTARLAAEEVVDAAFRKMARGAVRCRTADAMLLDTGDAGYDGFEDAAVARWRGAVGESLAREMTWLFGSDVDGVMGLYDGARGSGNGAPVDLDQSLDAAVTRWACREEMAVRLSDVAYRCSDVGSRGRVGEDRLRRIADVMADELGWSARRVEDEVGDVMRSKYSWRDGVHDMVRAGEESIG